MTKHEWTEQLSAYLDGELSPAERAEVEALLRQRPELAPMLDRYRELGDEIRQLPHHSLGSEFAPRVLAAAEQAAQQPARPASPRRSWLIAAATALVATAAGAIAIVAWRSDRQEVAQPPALSTSVQAVATALAQADEPGEAVVIRLKLTKDEIRSRKLDRALAAHGIGSAAATAQNEKAQRAAGAYRAKAAQDPADSQAADVLFIEAGRSQLAEALAAVAEANDGTLVLSSEGVVESSGGSPETRKAEGENGGQGDGTAKTPSSYAQHLPARGFPLAKMPVAGRTMPAPPADADDRPVRVLVVVEVIP